MDRNEKRVQPQVTAITEHTPADKKKIIRPSVAVRAVSTVPSVSNMLEDALSIMGQQIDRMRVKSGQHQSLDERESRVLQGYVKSLIEISREEREREKTDAQSKNLDKLTTEELVALATAQITANRPK